MTVEQEARTRLTQIIAALDASILSAVEAPQYAGGISLHKAASLCLDLENNRPLWSSDPNAAAAQQNEESELVWQIRSRVGRLKVLLDSAGAFYHGLSRSPLAEVGYDVQGQCRESSTGNLLRLDC